MVIGAVTLNMVPIGLVLKEKRTSKEENEDKESADQLLECVKLEGGGLDADKDVATASDFQTTGCQENVARASGMEADMTMNASSNNNTTHEKRQDGSGNAAGEATPFLESLIGHTQTGEISRTLKDHTAYRCKWEDHAETTYTVREADENRNCDLRDEECSQPDKDYGGWSAGRIFQSALAFIHFEVLIKEPLFSMLYLSSCLLVFVVVGGWALFVVLYAVEHGIDLSRAAYLPTSGASRRHPCIHHNLRHPLVPAKMEHRDLPRIRRHLRSVPLPADALRFVHLPRGDVVLHRVWSLRSQRLSGSGDVPDSVAGEFQRREQYFPFRRRGGICPFWIRCRYTCTTVIVAQILATTII